MCVPVIDERRVPVIHAVPRRREVFMFFHEDEREEGDLCRVIVLFKHGIVRGGECGSADDSCREYRNTIRVFF